MSITLKEIAKLCGVSIATVSKVASGKNHDISIKTREKVLEVIEEHGYIVDEIAQSMKTKKTDTLGLLIPDISNPFFTELAKGAEDEASKRGYSILLCNSYEDFKKELNYLKKLVQKRVDGILIAGTHERFISKEQKLKINVPMVAYDRKVFYPNIISTISSDNKQGAIDAVEHLISKGHKRIAYFGGEAKNLINISRYEGYVSALEKYSIEVDSDLVFFNNFTDTGGYGMMRKLKQTVDAIFCVNDLIAVGVIRYCQEVGIRIPQDMSLSGVDNTIFSSIMSPPLSTKDQQMYEMGKIGCRIMIDYLEGKDIDELVMFQQHLIERDSIIDKNY